MSYRILLLAITDDNTISWYALKVYYNRVSDIDKEINEAGLKTFVPMTTVVVERDGHRSAVKRPLISSLMFVRASADDIIQTERRLAGRASVYTMAEPPRRPAPISDEEMTPLMLLTSGEESNLEYLGDDTARYSVGQKVKVIDGQFAGAVGHICRIKGNRRLVVAIKGVCAVATSYIPSCFLEKI